MRCPITVASVVVCMWCTSLVSAEEVLREITWSQVAQGGKRGRLEVVRADDKTPFDRLKVTNAGREAVAFTVLALSEPKVTQAVYAIGGQVRHDAVEGKAYLEMWNVFPDGGRYFSRTLAAAGPLKWIKGTSAWRPFLLPFRVAKGKARPAKLVVNVVLPGRGTVEVGPLRLRQYASGDNPATADGQVLREVSWVRQAQAGALPRMDVVPADGKTTFDRLKIVNPHAEAVRMGVLTVDAPKITRARYALVGKLRCENVTGSGCVEMWSVFPDRKRYFTRTLAADGPMKRLAGSCDWRRFVLPFHVTKGKDRPTKLVVNVVLPGRGTVEFGPLRLVQYAEAEDPLAAGQWLGDRTAGVIGGVVGAAMGCLGGVIGWLGSRGRARRFVLGALRTMPVVGVALVAGGVAAVLDSQPYGLYYPLFLLGLLCVAVPLMVFRSARKRYEDLELRKMAAADVS